ncbi:hypothetical protein KP509_13G054400 [Ceratopteris richardii]|uniref:Uncharacterized protein n=1 Tax=Ceratopteris richardii TaxID=49495 RepID=A0A8T2TL76_CERRI|nr:hypothetical protein KP509_13G054400 [Ceratopteris richardii]
MADHQDSNTPESRRLKIFTYEGPWQIYAMNWTVRKDKRFRLGIGSFLEDYKNKVQIVQLDEETGYFISKPEFSFEHLYPPTKIMFVPDKECQMPDLLATSGDLLRVWQIHDDKVQIKSRLNRGNDNCAPLTSFDWNELEPKRIGTASIDTTCTIWDIQKEVVETQLIAHDKEVFDIAWGGASVFASVSADGSVRIFDLKDKEHSKIIYESPQPDTPLLRLDWNKENPMYIATILLDSPKVVILDLRIGSMPVAELQRHRASVNVIAWAPHSSFHICSAGEDSQAFLWDLASMDQPPEDGLDPKFGYTAGSAINQLRWSSSQTDWIAIASSSKLQILEV